MAGSPNTKYFSPYDRMIFRLCDMIKSDEFSAMKSACGRLVGGNKIPDRTIEALERPIELFEQLERRMLLTEDKTQILKELLSVSCHERADLRGVVEAYEREHGTLGGECETHSEKVSKELNEACAFLEQELHGSSGYIWVLRQMEIDDDLLDALKEKNHNSPAKVIREALDVWKFSDTASKETILNALRWEKEHTLAAQLELRLDQP